MSGQLGLFQIVNNERKLLGYLSGDEVLVGREPAGGIALPGQGVSRLHGKFFSVRSHWFFKDLGSTNGSWVNGEKAEQARPYLVKTGDLVQLADVAMQLLAGDEAGAGVRNLGGIGFRSLIIFSRGEFLEEYPIPEYGRALAVGGPKADLRLDVDLDDLPALVVERRGDSVCAFTVSREAMAWCNGKPIGHPVNLRDRDEVRVSHYSIIYNDVPGAVARPREEPPPELEPAPFGGAATPYQPQIPPSAQPFGEPRRPPVVDDWETPSVGRRAQGVFGRSLDEEEMEADETMTIESHRLSEELRKYDGLPTRRVDYSDEPGVKLNLESVEDKLILIFGILMILALFGVVMWWVLS